MNAHTVNWRAILFVALGLISVLASHYLLHVCAEEGMLMETVTGAKVPMRCSWSERAFLGVGGLVAFIGLAMLLFRDAARGLSLAASGAGALMVAIPLWLVPTCAGPEMTCNLSFKPGALLIGGIVALAGLIGTYEFRRLEAEGAR